MRVFAAYLLAGCLLLVASALLAPPEGFVLSYGAGSIAPRAQTPLQIVDRTNKGDRLALPSRQPMQLKLKPAPAKHEMLAGCDPAFSPLVASASSNFPRRCLA
ncbi:MAG: hypothetical protein ACK4UO_11570 [Pseudolabrys sp.]